MMALWHYFRNSAEYGVPGTNKKATLSDRARLAWVDDDTRLQVWEQCIKIVRLLESAFEAVQDCPSDHDCWLGTFMADWHDHGGTACNPANQVDKPSGLFLDALRTSIEIIRSLYSDHFMNSLQARLHNPTGHVDYGTDGADMAKLRSARAFLLAKSLPNVFRRLLDLPSFPERAVHDIADDFEAILDSRAMPSVTREAVTPPVHRVIWSAVQSRTHRIRDIFVTPASPQSPRLQLQPLTPDGSHDTPSISPPPTPPPPAPANPSFSTAAADYVNGFLRDDRHAQRQIASTLKVQKVAARQKRLMGARSTKRLLAGLPESPPPVPSRHRSRSRSGSQGSPYRSPRGQQTRPLYPYARYVQLTQRQSDESDLAAYEGDSDSDLDISAKLGVQLQLTEDQEQADEQAERERKRREAEEKARRAEEERRRQEEERARKSGGLRKPRRKFVPELGREWIEKAESTLDAQPDSILATVAASAGKVKLRPRDFGTLVPERVWLNDEVINAALGHVDQFVNEKAGVKDPKKQTRKCIAFNSFFFSGLRENVGNTSRRIGRWGINKDNFLSIETMLIPVCENSHWTLLVVRPTYRMVTHLDSLSPSGNREYRRIALAWVKAVLQEKWNRNEWREMTCKSPLQPNSSDCGMHTITNGICLALGLLPEGCYDTHDIGPLRQHIAAMLLNGGFTGDFDLSDV